MIFTYALSVWLFEHRSAAEVCPRFGGFLIGMTVGLLLTNLVFAVLWTSGHAMFSKADGWGALPYAFIGTFSAVVFGLAHAIWAFFRGSCRALNSAWCTRACLQGDLRRRFRWSRP
jgi:hypothetical protein